MSENHPTISVIIPVYNAGPFIAEAIESVLVQGWTPLEIIAVDDGSTDNSADVLQSFQQVRYFHHDNSGIGATRNLGIRNATGELLAFLDADDVWAADKLARQAAVLAADPSIDIVFGQVQQFSGKRFDPARSSEGMAGKIPSAMMIRRTSFDQAGLFDPKLKAGEFAGWFIRANEAGLKSVVLPEVVAYRRIHNTNNGIRNREHFQNYARILKASLDRRRAAAQRKSQDTNQDGEQDPMGKE